jgi:hypothetical protein
MKEEVSASADENNTPVHDIQGRLSQIESTMHVLKEELSRLRSGGASGSRGRERSPSITLDVSAAALHVSTAALDLSTTEAPDVSTSALADQEKVAKS